MDRRTAGKFPQRDDEMELASPTTETQSGLLDHKPLQCSFTDCYMLSPLAESTPVAWVCQKSRTNHGDLWMIRDWQLQPFTRHQRELIEHDPHEATNMSVAPIPFW